MIEFFETQPDCDVQEAEYKRLLGYPQSHVLQGRAKELAEWAARWTMQMSPAGRFASTAFPFLHRRCKSA